MDSSSLRHFAKDNYSQGIYLVSIALADAFDFSGAHVYDPFKNEANIVKLIKAIDDYERKYSPQEVEEMQKKVGEDIVRLTAHVTQTYWKSNAINKAVALGLANGYQKDLRQVDLNLLRLLTKVQYNEFSTYKFALQQNFFPVTMEATLSAAIEKVEHQGVLSEIFEFLLRAEKSDRHDYIKQRYSDALISKLVDSVLTKQQFDQTTLNRVMLSALQSDFDYSSKLTLERLVALGATGKQLSASSLDTMWKVMDSFFIDINKLNFMLDMAMIPEPTAAQLSEYHTLSELMQERNNNLLAKVASDKISGAQSMPSRKI